MHVKKPRKNLFFILLVLMVILQIVLTSFNTHPFIGASLSIDETGRVNVASVHRLGFLNVNGIVVGDEISSIDGEEANQFPLIDTDRNMEGATSFTVQRGDRFEKMQVTYQPDLFHQYMFYLIFPLFYFFLIVLLTVLMINKGLYNRSALLLSILLFLISLTYHLSSLSLKQIPFAKPFLILTILFIPVLFYHFIYQFFKEKNQAWFSKRSVYGLYFLTTLAILLSMSFLTLDTNRIFLSAFMFAMLYVMLQLFLGAKRFRKSNNIHLIYGVTIASGVAVMPLIVLYIVPYIILGESIMPFEYANLFIFFIPTIIIFLTLTDQLYLLRVRIRKLPYHLFLSFLLSAGITMIHRFQFATPMFSQASWSFLIHTFLMIIGLLLIKKQLDHLFIPQLSVEPHDFQRSLLRFSEILKRENKREDILVAFQREVKEVIAVRSVDIVKLSSMRVPNINETEISAIYHPVVLAHQNQRMEIGRLLGKDGTYLIAIHNHMNDLYVLFFETTEELFDYEHVDYLKTLIHFQNMALENQMQLNDLLDELEEARQSENMEWLSRLLFDWSEIERKNLTRDMHDSFLQELIVLNRNIEAFKKGKTNAPSIDDIKDLVQDIIYEIRETLSKVYPSIIDEVGFLEAINELIKKFKLRSNTTLYFYTNIKEAFYHDKNMSLMVFRIIQEWLNNAYRHAEAESVSIEMIENDEGLILRYEDDGKGMILDESYHANTRMGVLAIRERVRSLNGTIQSQSELGRGLIVEIKIPVE